MGSIGAQPTLNNQTGAAKVPDSSLLYRCWEFFHPLVVSRHEDECQARAQIAKREGDGEEGEELWSSCERCLLASEF